MSTPQDQPSSEEHLLVIGPDGRPVSVPADARPQVGEQAEEEVEDEVRRLTDLVEEPAKVMRIGRMVQQLLEEVKSAPVDAAGRKRLAKVTRASISELKDGLAPELDEELERLIHPFDEETPSESELRIAQAQLVGWLEGLFHGIQTAIYAQQMAARSQLEQMRRALPPGAMPGAPGPGEAGARGGLRPGEHEPGAQGGMYL